MKNRRLLPLLVAASFVSALGFGAVSLPSASAQPPAPAKAGKRGRAKAVKGGVPKGMMAKIETQVGKPLTEDQKERLNAAYKIRTEATKAAAAKFAEEVVKVTGLTTEQVAQLNKRGPRAGAAGKMAPA